VDEASHIPESYEAQRRVIYVFTICEYGGGEIASCRLTCGEAFADGFEVGLSMRIDEDTHHIVREELGEGEDTDHGVTLEPWIEAA
jgi:hypothetical protein